MNSLAASKRTRRGCKKEKYLLLAVVDQMSLLLDGVEERMTEGLFGGDALVRVKLKHGIQQLEGLDTAGREAGLEILMWKCGCNMQRRINDSFTSNCHSVSYAATKTRI